MTHEREHCNALRFEFEADKNGKFSNCCHKGKVILPNKPPYPNQLEELAVGETEDSIEYLKNIRLYNNSLAYASFGAHFDKIPRRGLRIIRICGQVYHNVYALHHNQDGARKYGQFYVLDNEMATKERTHSQSESAMNPQLLKQLDEMIRTNNPYAKAYKMMHEVEQEEIERCKRTGIAPKHVTMAIKRTVN